MDNRPIGIFDSGLGGLTSVPYLMKALPNERIIYFGDTARTPYGSKAVKTIRSFSQQIVEFLKEQNVKMIIIACNTVSATCISELQRSFPDIPIVGIIEPAAERVAKLCSEDNAVGIIGTKATVASGAYEAAVKKYNDAVRIKSVACPALVPLIEEGIIKSDIMDLTIRYYMEDFILENRIDTIVLGCTHYPLIRSNIERIFPDLRIINPSEEIISSVVSQLEKHDMFASDAASDNIFYASDLSENFVNMIDVICKMGNVQVKFKNLDLE